MNKSDSIKREEGDIILSNINPDYTAKQEHIIEMIHQHQNLTNQYLLIKDGILAMQIDIYPPGSQSRLYGASFREDVNPEFEGMKELVLNSLLAKIKSKEATINSLKIHLESIPYKIPAKLSYTFSKWFDEFSNLLLDIVNSETYLTIFGNSSHLVSKKVKANGLETLTPKEAAKKYITIDDAAKKYYTVENADLPF